MTNGSKSREHHWWPVGLQKKFWTDRHGTLSWIDPDGKIHSKKAKRRKVAKKSHGHTVFRQTVWEHSFEDDFASTDDQATRIVQALLDLKPLGRTPAEFFRMMRLFLKPDRKLKDLSRFYKIDESLHRSALLLIYSLLIRSPANRYRYERFPELVGLPPNEDVGKGNMSQDFRIAKELCEGGLISNQYFVLMHSPLKKYIFGDGSLDWLTPNLTAFRVDGRALVPLTPNLCIYICTPRVMPVSPNCASLTAAPRMVERVNEIIQTYSQDYLFFRGKPPHLTENFRQRQFLEHKKRTDVLLDTLDELAGNVIEQRFHFPEFNR